MPATIKQGKRAATTRARLSATPGGQLAQRQHQIGVIHTPHPLAPRLPAYRLASPNPRRSAARWPVGVLTIFSALPQYGIGLRLDGVRPAVSATVLYVLSSPVLLHGRRATAEDPLLSFTLAATWAVLFRPRQTWSSRAAAALAVAAKLTALAWPAVLGVPG